MQSKAKGLILAPSPAPSSAHPGSTQPVAQKSEGIASSHKEPVFFKLLFVGFLNKPSKALWLSCSLSLLLHKTIFSFSPCVFAFFTSFYLALFIYSQPFSFVFSVANYRNYVNFLIMHLIDSIFVISIFF